MTTRATAALLLTLSGTALGQATFQGLGDLPGGQFYSEGWGVSADGRVATGLSVTGGSGIAQITTAFWWDPSAGIQPACAINGVNSHGSGLSHDGTVAVGWVDFGFFSTLGIQAYINTAAGGTVLLGDLPDGQTGQARSYGIAISGDGQIVVGNGESGRGQEAFYCRVATGELVAMGSLNHNVWGSWASGVSADGSVIIGNSYAAAGQTQAYRWTQATGMIGIGYLPAAPGVVPISQAESISADGLVIVGESRSVDSAYGMETFRWTPAGGFTRLGDFAGGTFQSWAFAASADGSVVVGKGMIEGTPGPFGPQSAPRAFIWDSAHGLRDLRQVLVDAGANLTGWVLTEARGISADGLTIVGTGTDPDLHTQAWIAHLPPAPSCYANCDGSSAPPILNVSDFICFLNRFGAGDSYANCDNSTTPPTLNVSDFICYMNAYSAGCP